MDSLLALLWVIPIVVILVIAAFIWYRTQPQRNIHKSPRKQARPKLRGRDKREEDDIATVTREKMTRAQTMEEVFAIGKESLNRIKGQIKESKHSQRKKK